MKKIKRIYWDPFVMILIILSVLIPFVLFNIFIMPNGMSWWENFIQFDSFITIFCTVFIWLFYCLFVPTLLSSIYYSDIYDKFIVISNLFKKDINKVSLDKTVSGGIYKFKSYNPTVQYNKLMKPLPPNSTDWIYLFTEDVDGEYRLIFIHAGILAYCANTYYISTFNDRGYRESNDYFIWQMSYLIDYKKDKFIELFGEMAYKKGVELLDKYDKNTTKEKIPKGLVLFYRAIYEYIKDKIFLMPYDKYTSEYINKSSKIYISKLSYETVYDKLKIEELRKRKLSDFYPVCNKILIMYNLKIVIIYLLILSVFFVI